MTLSLVIASAILHLLYYCFALFYLLLFMRYLLNFLPLHLNLVRRFLFRATEPFLSYFRRLVCWRWRRHDFTPLLAVIVLVSFQQTALKCLIFVLLKARGAWLG